MSAERKQKSFYSVAHCAEKAITDYNKKKYDLRNLTSNPYNLHVDGFNEFLDLQEIYRLDDLLKNGLWSPLLKKMVIDGKIFSGQADALLECKDSSCVREALRNMDAFPPERRRRSMVVRKETEPYLRKFETRDNTTLALLAMFEKLPPYAVAKMLRQAKPVSLRESDPLPTELEAAAQCIEKSFQLVQAVSRGAKQRLSEQVFNKTGQPKELARGWF